MSRYLTPSTIGLLALISLYAESVVPSAATVPLLSFLISRLLPIPTISSHIKSQLHLRDRPIKIDDFQKATISHVSVIPGRTVWDLLLQKLWKIDSCDSLHVFFDALSALLQKTPEEQKRETQDVRDFPVERVLLSRASPLGSFVRRAQLEFTRLPFHEDVMLWKAFVTFRASTLSQWKKRNSTAGKSSFDSNLGDDHLALHDPLSTLLYGEIVGNNQQQDVSSTEDVERLLNHQVDRMQSKSISQDSVSTCPLRWI